jgi:hypothetical protein
MIRFTLKVLGSCAVAGAIMYALFVAFGCATPQPITTPEEVKVEARASNPCMVIGETYCAKGEMCGAWLFKDCVAAFEPVCAQVHGITPREAEACALAIIGEACDGSMPEECVGISVNAESPEGTSL